MKLWPGAMPGKLMPGTPSYWNGTSRPCQWIEESSASVLRTVMVTSSPFLQANERAGDAAVDGDAMALAAFDDAHPLADAEVERRAANFVKAGADVAAVQIGAARPGRQQRRTQAGEHLAAVGAGHHRLLWRRGEGC